MTASNSTSLSFGPKPILDPLLMKSLFVPDTNLRMGGLVFDSLTPLLANLQIARGIGYLEQAPRTSYPPSLTFEPRHSYKVKEARGDRTEVTAYIPGERTM